MSSKAIEVKTSAGRIFLMVAGLLCVIAALFAFKWCFGNALATQAEEKHIAELGAYFAPGDPQTHFTLAVLNEKTFLPEDFQKAVQEYEKAAALSPNDFRMWFHLGKARERNGDSAGAENALRKSLELAPNYSEVQWTLGNLLLRQGKSSEAFNLIRQAADGNERFVDPAVSTAWQIFDGDISQVKQNIGNSPKINAALASFLLKQERFDESFNAWNSLPSEERKTVFRQRGEDIYNQLISAGKYRKALKIWAEIADDKNRKYEIGKMTDGGFEINEKQEKTSIFDWQIAGGAQPLIGVDTENVHGGSLSQRIIFNSPGGADFRQILQTVVVEAGKKYEFSMFYKSDLKTSPTLKWEIVNASDGRVLTATEPIAAKSDWTNLKAEFIAANTEAVIIRLARASCNSAVCPISGSVWFDDFVLSAK